MVRIKEDIKASFGLTTTTEDGEVVPVDDTTPLTPRTAPFFKTPYNHDTDQVARETALLCPEKTKTQQHLAQDADINNILRKFMQTGEPPPMGTPIYQDIDNLPDLQDIMITAHQVEMAWNKLPEAARELLGDPLRFTRYVDRALETGDAEALRRVDLLPPPKAPEPPTPTGGTPAPVPAEGAPKAP